MSKEAPESLNLDRTPQTDASTSQVILRRETLGRICNWTIWVGGATCYAAFGLFLGNLSPFVDHRDLARWVLRWHLVEWLSALLIVEIILGRMLYGFRFVDRARIHPDAYIFLSRSIHDIWRVPLMFIFVAGGLAFLFVVLGFPLLFGLLFLYGLGGH